MSGPLTFAELADRLKLAPSTHHLPLAVWLDGTRYPLLLVGVDSVECEERAVVLQAVTP